MAKAKKPATHNLPATSQPVTADRLLVDIRDLIEQSREQVARAVNAVLVTLYWQIGKRIRQELLQEKRAEYGQQIVDALSRQLTEAYGRGFTRANLFHMVHFAEVFPDEQVVHALRTQLSWTHFRELLAIKDLLKREFYAELCRVERWSTRTLQSQVKRLLYERTAVSKKSAEVIRSELATLRDEDRTSPDLVFRDPYFLDFLGLSGSYSEKDVEQAILRELEMFLLELGSDFAFVARQKRLTIDNEDYYVDLLFYHRRLRRLVAIDLKLGRFQAADKGQMELYLRWLEEFEMQPSEEPPLGLILCVDKSDEHVRLLRLDESGIHIAQYLTELPPQELLEKKLHDSIRLARERLAGDNQDAPPNAKPETTHGGGGAKKKSKSRKPKK